MAHNSTSVVTRYAPSPTGFQHIGGIRTALFAYLYAKKHHGTFILRIEDTDKNREVAGAIDHTIAALRWLGLDYDFGPDKAGHFSSVLQSDRLDIYKTYADQLIAKGLAYPDPYTTEELTAFRDAATAEKRPFLYRDHRPTQFDTWDGTRALRFKVPEIKRYTWHDAVRGTLTAGEEMLDDFILIKADGYPTYNFAHIIDDLEMGVTHVMRGEEFISSTPKFLSLYDALDIPYPTLVTLPPILGPDGKKKLSKRDGAKDLFDYRTNGYVPEAMVNFLALIGWNPGTEQELFTLDELIQNFNLDQIQRAGGTFNEAKLAWMNKEYLEKLSPEEFLDYMEPILQPLLTTATPATQEQIKRLVPTIRERIHHCQEAYDEITAGEYDYVFGTINYDTNLLAWKKDASVEAVLPRLEQLKVLLESADFSSSESLKNALWPYAEAVGRGEVLWPLRVALSGKERSPDPFTLAYILGQSTTNQRIKAACDKIKDNATT